ncbi:MAG: type II secretion system protein [Bacillota bacterium]|nr:type II secretion system protein [Bacillota bacterium]
MFAKRQQGASMVEVLVVVAILAIVASIAIPRIQGASAADRGGLSQREQWEQAACRFNLSIAQNATEYFAIFIGQYPLTPDELYPKFLDRIPTCPAHGSAYTYDEHHIIKCEHHRR